MDKGIIVHRLSLNMEDQRVQATITLAQGDAFTHRLVVDLRHGTEIVELEHGTSAVICVQNPAAGIDVLGDVTVYGANGVYPNCLVCDVNPAITTAVGMHEACFVLHRAPGGAFASLNTPKFAFSVRSDLMSSSNLELNGNEPYSAIVRALLGAQEAQAVAEKEADAFKNAVASAETVEPGEQASVVVSKECDKDGNERVKFEFSIPQGVPGATGGQGPQGERGCVAGLKIIDGKLYAQYEENGSWEYVGVSAISLGDGSEGVTGGSLAFGEDSVAGARGFGVTAFNHSKRQITLALTSPVTGVRADAAYEVGDKFSILNGTHYAFCGEITSINGNIITYKPTTEHGTNSSRKDPWWVFDPISILYPVRAVFWVPTKPLVGYDLNYEGEDAFPNATAFCGGKSSAKGAVVSGEGSAAGGNYAAIFGPEILAAYGNISSGRENFSTGLHSGLIGRWLVNHGDYNFLAGKGDSEKKIDTIRRGICNAGFGSTNTLHQGDCNGFFGHKLSMFGDYNIISGFNHEIGDAEKEYKANYNDVSGKQHKIAKDRAVSYCNVSGVGHTVNHEGVDVSGWNHKSSRDYQVLRGFGSTPDAGAAFILALGKNIFTIGADGTRKDVGTDAVTVDFLKKYVEDQLSYIPRAEGGEF